MALRPLGLDDPGDKLLAAGVVVAFVGIATVRRALPATEQ